MKAVELLLEIDQDDIGRFDPNDDKIDKKKLGDRRSRITLKHLNKLKKIRATKKLELLKKRDLLNVMYGLPPAESEGEMPPGF